MKKYKKKILKTVIASLVLLFIGIHINTVFGYQIHAKMYVKENLHDYIKDEGYNYPDLLYRRQISAYYTERNTYLSKVGYDEDKWAYEDNINSMIDSNGYTYNDTSHGTLGSYKEIYDFFHKSQNTVYDTNTSSNKYKYMTGTLELTDKPVTAIMSYSRVNPIMEETENYSGFYYNKATTTSVSEVRNLTESNFNEDIVVFNDNQYRYAVKNSNGGYVYVSDHYLTNNTAQEIVEKFLISGTDNVTVYHSSVLRGYSSNKKYYQNMDTSFKFWETTLRGKSVANWGESGSILGGTNGTRAAINYYDNTYEIPVGKSLQVYVRHIDVSDIKEIKSENITNANIIDVTNTRVIEHANNDFENLNDYIYGTKNDDGTKTRWEENASKFSEYYTKSIEATEWRFGNIKYEYTNAEGEYFSALDSDNATEKERNILNNYNCIGAVVGKGEDLSLAVSDKNNRLDDINDIRALPEGHTADGGNIIIGKDWTSVTVLGEESNPVVVIDFYYEKKPTNIYVRHIDVTEQDSIRDSELLSKKSKIAFVQTGVGKAFKLNSLNIEEAIGWVADNFKGKNTIPQGSTSMYQEYFIKNAGAGPLSIANIVYDHPTAGSYWNLIKEAGKENEYKDYICIGTAVGKGTSIVEAETNRSIAKDNANATTKNSLANFKYGTIQQADNSFVNNGGNYTYVVLENNDYNTVVIDFYYIKSDDPTMPDYPAPDDIKQVYVRHIDITGIDNFTSENITRAAINSKLTGLGYAIKNQSEKLIKDNKSFKGYQERYTIRTSDSLLVSKDNSEYYNCVGSNMMSANAGTIEDLQEDMDEQIDKRTNNKYDVGIGTREVIPDASGSDIVLIDFYYVNKNTGNLINRKPVGRLSFYTTDDSSEFASSVDNPTTSNSSTTICDIIPSNETLRMSIDNAYTYMLGAINIQEQTKDGTYVVKYTIKQPYEVTYNIYTEKCDENGENCKDVPAGTDTYEDTIDKTFTYEIPYFYTYYKVKNMRLYTIDKIQLLDDYEKNVLPLFDGKTHTIEPAKEYIDGIANSNFTPSTDFVVLTGNGVEGEGLNYSKKLSSTFTYTIDNESNISNAKIREEAEDSIEPKLKTLTNSAAATIEKFRSQEGADYIVMKEPVKAMLHIKNDEVSFEDKVAGKTIYIVGENKNKEKEATKVINLSTYDDTNKVEVKTDYPKSVNKKYEPTDSTTNLRDEKEKLLGGANYFTLENLVIPINRLNGKRYSYGKIYYSLVSGNNDLNFDVDDDKVKNGDHNWNSDSNRITIYGDGGNTFIDTEMYNYKGVTNPSETTLISPGTLNPIVWEYGKDSKKDADSTDADIVDVFSPIAFTTKIVGNDSKDKKVDHTITPSENPNIQIQKNSRFTVSMNIAKNSTAYSSVSTSKYLSEYYIKFDFDVQDIKITDARGANRAYTVNYVESGTWIGPIYNRYNNTWVDEVQISSYALEDPNEASGVVDQEQNEYEVRAFAINTPSSLKNYMLSKDIDYISSIYISANENKFSNNNSQSHNDYYNQKNILGHSNYAAYDTVTTENISRVYDFKVTDLKDVDWKNIFRKSSTTTTNVHSGKAYYSGINKWNTYTTAYNDMVERDVSEIGMTNKLTLPLGPYKNTNNTYVKAPKLGYRFSFDLKTTGANANKKIVITPSFYYISKDGTTYKDDIELYYKNSNNKYVSIDNYNLYFVPDDGYRLSFKETDYRFSSSSMKKTSIGLFSIIDYKKCIVLTKDMMQQTDNGFVQIWYGEYKLPNSTIAVKTGDDINKRLTNGYIGVKFKIEVWEYTNSSMTTISKKLSYLQNDNNSSKTVNTSQWDYEGYLGVKAGETADVSIALENGIWHIDNDRYNDIKGTVILYDTDARASSDYD